MHFSILLSGLPTLDARPAVARKLYPIASVRRKSWSDVVGHKGTFAPLSEPREIVVTFNHEAAKVS
jgi:hypothetical protein